MTLKGLSGTEKNTGPKASGPESEPWRRFEGLSVLGCWRSCHWTEPFPRVQILRSSSRLVETKAGLGGQGQKTAGLSCAGEPRACAWCGTVEEQRGSGEQPLGKQSPEPASRASSLAGKLNCRSRGRSLGRGSYSTDSLSSALSPPATLNYGCFPS